MECLLESPSSTCIRLIVIYRPPPSKKNKLFCVSALSSLMSRRYQQDAFSLLETSTSIWNLHDDTTASVFHTRLDPANLVQHVHSPTHRTVHTLDPVVTRASENTIQDLITENGLLSDHLSIWNLIFTKRHSVRKEILCRKTRKINNLDFKQDLRQSAICS